MPRPVFLACLALLGFLTLPLLPGGGVLLAEGGAFSSEPGVTLRPERPDGSRPREVEVAVLDERGYLRSSGFWPVSAQGEVFVPTPAPGSWRLLIAEPGGATLERTVIANQDMGLITLPRYGYLVLATPELARQRLSFELEIRESSGRPYRSVRDGDRTPIYNQRKIEMPLPEGAWVIDLEAADGRRWQRAVLIEEGREEVLEVP